jgi:hypothetical protein
VRGATGARSVGRRGVDRSPVSGDRRDAGLGVAAALIERRDDRRRHRHEQQRQCDEESEAGPAPHQGTVSMGCGQLESAV